VQVVEHDRGAWVVLREVRGDRGAQRPRVRVCSIAGLNVSARDVYFQAMRPSLTARVSRAGFGLLAIWCLGCTSFDVLLDALLRENVGARAACVMPGDATPQSASHASVIQSQSNDASAPGCGCDHCIAVQVAKTEVVVAPHAAPESVHHKLGSALSIAREPLVPPPIAGSAV